MYFTYLNSKLNDSKRNKILLANELLNKELKSKNNILFDEFAEKITRNIKENKIISKYNINNKNSDSNLMDYSFFKKINFNHYLKTETNKIKYRNTNPTKYYSLQNKKEMNIGIFNNQTLDKIRADNKLFNREKGILFENYNYNNNILKTKIDNFILSSKELFKEENKFNSKMKKIFQHLRNFYKNNKSEENKINIPKIKKNINHNHCFSLDKIIKNNNIYQTSNKTRNKFHSIQNSRYLNKEKYNLKTNLNISILKLNKKVFKIPKRQKTTNLTNINEHIIKKNKLKHARNNLYNQRKHFVKYLTFIDKNK